MHQLGFPLEESAIHAASDSGAIQSSRPSAETQRTLCSGHASRSFGSFTAREFHLIESKLKPTGAEYTTLQSFPFVAET